MAALFREGSAAAGVGRDQPQRNILRLLNLPASIYTHLDVESANPP